MRGGVVDDGAGVIVSAQGLLSLVMGKCSFGFLYIATPCGRVLHHLLLADLRLLAIGYLLLR